MAEAQVEEPKVEGNSSDWIEQLEKKLQVERAKLTGEVIGADAFADDSDMEPLGEDTIFEPPSNLTPGSRKDLEGLEPDLHTHSLSEFARDKFEQGATDLYNWGRETIKDTFIGKDGKPSYAEDFAVRGVGSGMIEGLKNSADFFGIDTLYEEGSKVLDYIGLDHNLVFNLPGLVGYDSSKPLVFLSSDGYLEEKIREGEAFHLPTYPEPEYKINQVVKPLSRYLAGFLLARRAIPAKYDPKGYARDAVGSVLAFEPNEPRLADLLEEYVEDTPIPLLEGVIHFLKSDPDDSASWGYLKLILEGSAIGKGGEGLVMLSMLTYGTARKYYHAMKEGASNEDLAQITEVGAAEIKAYMDGVPKTKENADALEKFKKIAKKKEREEAKKVPKGTTKTGTKVHKEKMTPEEELVLKAVALNDKDITDAVLSILSGNIKPNKRILNIGASKEVGWQQVISAIASVYKKRNVLKRTYHTIKSGPNQGRKKAATGLIERETEEVTKRKGEDIYDEMTEFEVAATIRGESANKLKKSMLAKYRDVKDAGAHMFAYRVVLRDLSLDLASNIDNNLDKLHDPKVLFALQNDFQELSNLYFYYGHIRGELARSVTSMRIDIPSKWMNNDGTLKKLTKEEEGFRDAFLSAQMQKNKWNPEMVQMIGDIMRQTGDPMKAIALIDRGVKAVREGGMNAFMEIYRNIILGSTTVFETAIVSGIVESFYPMVRDTIGGVLVGGVRTAMGKPAQMDVVLESAHRTRGIMLHFPRAAKQALWSLLNERNVLDPLRSIVDESNKQMTTQYAIAANPNASGALATALNLTGKAVRLTTRGIGTIDEFLKQINYGSYAYGKIMMRMPDEIKKAPKAVRRKWTKQQLGEWYDSLGRATNAEGLEYARKVVFQENLVPKTISSDLQAFVKNHPPAELYVPIMRTPANVVKRITERTVGMSAARAEVRRKWMGTPEEQAEVLGDVVISTTLLGATASLITEGTITGAGPTDPAQRKLWIDAGNKPYRIQIGDLSIPYDRLAPFSAPVMMVANVYENSWIYNNNRDEVSEKMLLAILQSLGDMHFISSFHNFFRAIEEAKRTGEGWESLVEKPIGKNMRMPKIIGQASHAFHGNEGFKEVETLGERWQVDIANVTGNWETLGGEKWNWITGEAVEKDISYWSGYAWQDYEEPNPVVQELVRMGLHVTAPQRFIPELGIQLLPEQFADYKYFIGNTPVFKDPKTGQRMRMIETLSKLMESKNYGYDSNRYYPETPKPNWRVDKVKKIVRKYKDVAMEMLLKKYPSLKEKMDIRRNALIQDSLSTGKKPLKHFPDIKETGYGQVPELQEQMQ